MAVVVVGWWWNWRLSATSLWLVSGGRNSGFGNGGGSTKLGDFKRGGDRLHLGTCTKSAVSLPVQPILTHFARAPVLSYFLPKSPLRVDLGFSGRRRVELVFRWFLVRWFGLVGCRNYHLRISSMKKMQKSENFFSGKRQKAAAAHHL